MLTPSELYPRGKWPAANRCIYCGKTKPPLKDEHVLPLALQIPGMDWFLPNATCEPCRIKTHTYEQNCLRVMLGPIRYRLKLKSRKGIPKTIPVTIALPPDDREEIRHIPSEKYPIICPGFRLPPLGVISGQMPSMNFSGEKVVGWSQSETETLFPDASAIVLKVYAIDFMRLLAKIAHGYICGEYPELKMHSLLIPFILGEFSPVAHLIGSDTSPNQPEDENLMHHIYRLDIDQGGIKYIGVSIRIFANLKMPRYHIIVGQQYL